MKIISGKKASVFFLALFILFSGGYSRQACAEEKELYGTASHWLWKEFGAGNDRFLQESGWVPGLGFSYDTEFSNQATFRQSAELFGGRIDYDGQTQAGVPATAKTDYLGFDVKAEAGIRKNITEEWSLEPFTGLGIRIWRRDINNGRDINGNAVQGYTERWTTVNILLGLRATLQRSASLRLYGEAGAKVPLYNENYVYLSDISAGSDVSLEPGKQISYFAEIGMKYQRLRAGLFYEDYRFPQSDNVYASQTLYYYQPKSSLEMAGLKVGYIF